MAHSRVVWSRVGWYVESQTKTCHKSLHQDESGWETEKETCGTNKKIDEGALGEWDHSQTAGHKVLVLSLQAHFLFAARVFIRGPLCHPTLTRWGPQTTPQWRLCACPEWQTCPYKLQGTPPPDPHHPSPHSPATRSHTHTYKQMDCITDFPFSGAVFHGIRSRQTWRRILVIRLQIIEQECLRWEPRGGSDKTAGWLHVPPMMIRSCVALTWRAEKLMRGLIIACNWFTCFHFFPFSMCAACLWACCIMNHQHLKRGPNSSPGIVNIYW